MKTVALLILALAPQRSHAENLWKDVAPWTEASTVDHPANSIHTSTLHLSKQQTRSVLRTLHVEPEELECADLSSSQIQISPRHKVIFVVAGQGCMRGAGANGAMFLVQFDGGHPILIGKLYGWLYSVQRRLFYGYRDIVIGWHINAYETGLAYFRYDGNEYKAIGGAIACREKIFPNASTCPIPRDEK